MAKPDWSSFYDNLEEELPPQMPEPLGHSVNIHVFVDANHAGNVVTRRSHTGILAFVQNSLIIRVRRRKDTVETSTFGSEFVALRTARDVIIALRYKLRMFGVPLEGPAQVYSDNQGVVKNASIPESVLDKKHNAINFHVVREATASGVLEGRVKKILRPICRFVHEIPIIESTSQTDRFHTLQLMIYAQGLPPFTGIGTSCTTVSWPNNAGLCDIRIAATVSRDPYQTTVWYT